MCRLALHWETSLQSAYPEILGKLSGMIMSKVTSGVFRQDGLVSWVI